MDYNDKIAKVYPKCIITSPAGVCLDGNGIPQIRCPSCLKWGSITDHGFRVMPENGVDVLRSQSWCYECRKKAPKSDPDSDE